MYKYLEDLDEGCSYAVVNTEGRICVLASEKAVRKYVALRHYAFLLDFMNVPADDILFVCVDRDNVRKVTIKFCRMCGGLPCRVVYVGELDDCSGEYEYVVVYDAHNVDVFTVDRLKGLCAKANNIYICIDYASIMKNHNVDLADLLKGADFDFEISTDGNGSVAKYLEETEEELEKLYRKRELEELHAKKLAEREAKRKLQEERMAAEKKAKLEAEREEKERLEREQRAEAERKRAEEEAARRAEELRKKQNNPLFTRLKPYMDWYFQNWTVLADKGAGMWKALSWLHEKNEVDASNFVQCMKCVRSEYGQSLSGKMMRLLENIKMCGTLCPDETALLLHNLLNEKDTVQMRMMLCRNQAMRLSELMRHRSWKMENVGLADVEAMADCLAWAYPEKHYFLRVLQIERFGKKVGVEVPSVSVYESKKDFFEREYVNLERFCDDIREVLTVNMELMGVNELNKGGCDAKIFDNHLLTVDFICAVAEFFVAFGELPNVGESSALFL